MMMAPCHALHRALAWILLLAIAPSGHAAGQSLGDLAKKTAAEREKRAKETPPSKVFTNNDLPTGPAAVAPKPIEIDKDDAKTREALTALRATQSALDGGANAAEFKKYFLEAKIKVDALPASESASALRAISELYEDTVTLSIARFTKSLSGTVLADLKLRYAGDYEFIRYMNDVPTDGIGPRLTTYRTEVAIINVRAAEQVLLARAAERLKLIKQ